ncbi:MAG: ATP-dependent helicase [Patescibacteria group bacterium]
MKLNAQQKQAVEYTGGPLMIIAGAGTGKTTVITEKIKWLIAEQNLNPSEILALTFTEKAAREMEERVDLALPIGYSQLWISTFHSFCDRVLKDEAIQIGLNPNFKLMTGAETIFFLQKNLFDFKLNYFRPNSNPNKFLSALASHFSRLQDEDIDPKQYLTFAKKMPDSSPEEKLEKQKTIELATVFDQYQKAKEKEGLLDFADLISQTIKLFRQRANVLSEYRKRFRFVLIDEFQDTNIAQYELIKLLAPPKSKPNLTVTGDDSQAIYKFRGAAISNILAFKQDYPDSQMVVLSQNYRSTQAILDSAYQLIKYNDPDTLEAKLGISKNLTSARKIKGQTPKLIFENQAETEADMIVKTIKRLHQGKEKYQFKDFAILVRANSQADLVCQVLSRAQVPNQFLGPSQLFRQTEIKELVAYLSLLANPQDDLAFFKVASMDIFDIPEKNLALLRGFAKKTICLSLKQPKKVKIQT